MSRSYCFTSYDIKEPIFNKEKVRYLVYQREKCPKTNNLHWQGYAEFFKSHRMKGASEILGLSKKWLSDRKGTRTEARNYCTKEDSRVEKPKEFGIWLKGQGHRTDLDELVSRIEKGATNYELLKDDTTQYERYFKFIDKCRKVIKEHSDAEYTNNYHKNITLNSTQQLMKDKLDNQNDREITWVYDPEGNKGKTVFSKYMISKYKAQRFTNGKTKDIAFAYTNAKYVCFDFARSCEDRINYQIIEDLKNGILFSSKYESKSFMFEPPKIIILANFYPDINKLSTDRWDILQI